MGAPERPSYAYSGVYVWDMSIAVTSNVLDDATLPHGSHVSHGEPTIGPNSAVVTPLVPPSPPAPPSPTEQGPGGGNATNTQATGYQQILGLGVKWIGEI